VPAWPRPVSAQHQLLLQRHRLLVLPSYRRGPVRATCSRLQCEERDYGNVARQHLLGSIHNPPAFRPKTSRCPRLPVTSSRRPCRTGTASSETLVMEAARKQDMRPATMTRLAGRRVVRPTSRTGAHHRQPGGNSRRWAFSPPTTSLSRRNQ